DRCHTRPCERRPAARRPPGHLSRPVRRILRHRPCNDALRGRGGGDTMTARRNKPQGLRLHRELTAIWGTPPGLARLAAVNHTVVGRRFMLTAFAFFAIGGLLAMLIRVQL